MSTTLVLNYQLPTLNEYINIERSNRFKAAAAKKKHTTNVYLFAVSSDLKLDHSKKYDIKIIWKAGKLKGDGHKQIGNIHHYFKHEKGNKFTTSEIMFY